MLTYFSGPPSIQIKPGPVITSLPGQRVKVECVGIGDPTPNVQWQRSKRRHSDVLPEQFSMVFQFHNLLFDR